MVSIQKYSAAQSHGPAWQGGSGSGRGRTQLLPELQPSGRSSGQPQTTQAQSLAALDRWQRHDRAADTAKIAIAVERDSKQSQSRTAAAADSAVTQHAKAASSRCSLYSAPARGNSPDSQPTMPRHPFKWLSVSFPDRMDMGAWVAGSHTKRPLTGIATISVLPFHFHQATAHSSRKILTLELK